MVRKRVQSPDRLASQLEQLKLARDARLRSNYFASKPADEPFAVMHRMHG
jgi:hypothetical protein